MTELTATSSQNTFQQISKQAMTKPSSVLALLCQTGRTTEREMRMWKPVRANLFRGPQEIKLSLTCLGSWISCHSVNLKEVLASRFSISISACLMTTWLPSPYLRSRHSHVFLTKHFEILQNKAWNLIYCYCVIVRGLLTQEMVSQDLTVTTTQSGQ